MIGKWQIIYRAVNLLSIFAIFGLFSLSLIIWLIMKTKVSKVHMILILMVAKIFTKTTVFETVLYIFSKLFSTLTESAKSFQNLFKCRYANFLQCSCVEKKTQFPDELQNFNCGYWVSSIRVSILWVLAKCIHYCTCSVGPSTPTPTKIWPCHFPQRGQELRWFYYRKII